MSTAAVRLYYKAWIFSYAFLFGIVWTIIPSPFFVYILELQQFGIEACLLSRLGKKFFLGECARDSEILYAKVNR